MSENPIEADLQQQWAAASDEAERNTIRAAVDGMAARIRAELAAEPLPGEAWEPVDPPPREWLIPGMVPAGRLAALYGTGGAGKSTLALQLAAAVMHGGSPLRTAPDTRDPERLVADHPVLQPLPEARRGRVLWLTWEDEVAEVVRRWRMAHHAGAIRPAFPNPNQLTLVDMRQVGGPLWGPERGGHVSTVASWTEAGRRFLHTLRGHRLAIVDPLAAAFASSEIDRSLVRAFTSAIDGEAEAAGCTVLLIAHPSQAGAGRDGGGYSGSTDWQASVRAHLILEASDNTGHSFVEGNGKAPGWRLANPKQSYASDGGHLWLTRHWRTADPEHNTPAELAWFGTRAGNAASAFERTTAKRGGRRPRDLSGPDVHGNFVPGTVPWKSASGATAATGFNEPPPV